MKNDKTDEILFDLVSSKAFGQLTAEEKNLVLSRVTEDEYSAMAELNSNVAYSLKQEKPFSNALLKNKLMGAYDKKHELKPVIRTMPLFSRGIPFYQAAAAVIAVMLLMAGWHYFGASPASPAEATIVYRTDTVYLPSKAAVQFAEKDQQEEKDEKQGGNKDLVNSSLKQQVETAVLCRSIKKDSGLKQFMVAGL